jgi:hypothetical protein
MKFYKKHSCRSVKKRSLKRNIKKHSFRRKINKKNNTRKIKRRFGGNSEEGCPICLEPFNGMDEICRLPCNHKFCCICIHRALRIRNPACPLCRASTVPAQIIRINQATGAVIENAEAYVEAPIAVVENAEAYDANANFTASDLIPIFTDSHGNIYDNDSYPYEIEEEYTNVANMIVDRRIRLFIQRHPGVRQSDLEIIRQAYFNFEFGRIVNRQLANEIRNWGFRLTPINRAKYDRLPSREKEIFIQTVRNFLTEHNITDTINIIYP